MQNIGLDIWIRASCQHHKSYKHTHANHTKNDVIFKKIVKWVWKHKLRKPSKFNSSETFQNMVSKPLWVPEERFDTILGFKACYPFKFSQTLKTEHKKNSPEFQSCRFLICYSFVFWSPFHVAWVLHHSLSPFAHGLLWSASYVQNSHTSWSPYINFWMMVFACCSSFLYLLFCRFIRILTFSFVLLIDNRWEYTQLIDHIFRIILWFIEIEI